MTIFQSILDAPPIQSGSLNFASNGLQQPILMTESGSLIILWNNTIYVISQSGYILSEISLATLTNGLGRNPPNGFVGLDSWCYIGNGQIAYFDNYANNGLGIITFDALYRWSIFPQAARYAAYVASMASVPSGTFSNSLNGVAYFFANQNGINTASKILNLATGSYFAISNALTNGNMLLSTDGNLYISNLSGTNNLYIVNPNAATVTYQTTSPVAMIFSCDDDTYLYASPTPNIYRFHKGYRTYTVEYLGTNAYTNIIGIVGGYLLLLDFENGNFLKVFWAGANFVQGVTFNFPDTAALGNTNKLLLVNSDKIRMIYEFKGNGALPLGIFDLSESLYYQIFPTFVYNYSWLNKSPIALKSQAVYFNLQTKG